MKRFIILLGFILLTACSSKPPVELVSASVDIVNDIDRVGAIGITEGEKKGQELVPTALYYEFTIKNIGNEKIGDPANKGLDIKIEPNDDLVASSKEIIGFNIFNPSEYDASGMGYGETYESVLKLDQEGKFTFHYDLGVSEENPNVRFLVPSKEQLKKLNDNALDATLIVFFEDKEIARFDLREK